MISKQKAKRIAYGIVCNVLMDTNPVIGDEWQGADRIDIDAAIGQVLAELKKKSQ